MSALLRALSIRLNEQTQCPWNSPLVSVPPGPGQLSFPISECHFEFFDFFWVFLRQVSFLAVSSQIKKLGGPPPISASFHSLLRTADCEP